MSHPGGESTVALEITLGEILSALRPAVSELGAQSISMFLLEKHVSIRFLYEWPETSRLPGNALELKNELSTSLSTLAGFVCAESPLADCLANICGCPRSSFMVFPWGTPRRRVIVAFGFDSGLSSAVRLPSEAAAVIHLAALAAWSVQEISRLRGELGVVSDRLGGRKLVEKAKALLLAKEGLDEPRAYAYLRRLSRQRRTRMTEIARDLLEASESVQNVTV